MGLKGAGVGRRGSTSPPHPAAAEPAIPFHPSSSPDVLPPDVMNELARLQDQIKPFSSAEARAMIEADLGRPIDDIFSEFSDEPVGAASLAQVRGGWRRLREVCGVQRMLWAPQQW